MTKQKLRDEWYARGKADGFRGRNRTSFSRDEGEPCYWSESDRLMYRDAYNDGYEAGMDLADEQTASA